VRDLFESHADVAAEQLLLEPAGSGLGSAHGGRQKLVYDFFDHLFVLLRNISANTPNAGFF
jgi:hypothetical protein